jgi:hypothetical protein
MMGVRYGLGSINTRNWNQIVKTKILMRNPFSNRLLEAYDYAI